MSKYIRRSFEIPLFEIYQELTVSLFFFLKINSSGSDYRHAPPNPDLKKFMCTESISYLGEFDLGSDSSSESEDDENYGQEFYLGNLLISLIFKDCL